MCVWYSYNAIFSDSISVCIVFIMLSSVDSISVCGIHIMISLVDSISVSVWYSYNVIPWLQWFEPCVSFYYYMARKETMWYHGIKQILAAHFSADGEIYCPSVLWRPLLFPLGPSAHGKIVAVSREPRGNSFNHLPHEQSIFVYYIQ